MKNKDMRSDVLKIALPALAELFLVQLCSMVDTMMVGRLGPWALSAVGYCSQPRFLLLAVFIALNTGSTALIARAKGEGNKELANSVLQQTLLMTVILSLIISVVGYFASRPMVIFMGADEEHIIKAATGYMKIQMASFGLNAVTMSITACLRGIGKTKVSMYYNMISNVVNVIFNFLLIYGIGPFPRLEVQGASIATVIGQFVAFGIAVSVILRKDDYLNLQFKNLFNVNKSIIQRIVKIGAPAMVEQLIMRAGMLIYTLTITSLGSLAFATHQIAGSILTMTFMTGQAFGIAATSLLGQSLGMRNVDNAKTYTLICRRMGMLCAIGLGIIFIFFGKPIASLYTDDIDVINEAGKILMIVAILQPLQSSQLILNGALRGAGDTTVVAIITFIGILILRPIISLIMIRFFGLGLVGAWIAMGIDQSFRSLVSMLRFKSNKWMYIKV